MKKYSYALKAAKELDVADLQKKFGSPARVAKHNFLFVDSGNGFTSIEDTAEFIYDIEKK